MVKHNHAIPNVHLRKHWHHLVKTFFNQPAKKRKRQEARQARAAKLFPRPTSYLRPMVRCPTRRYNMKVRYGRGFTLEELKLAGLNPAYARTIGIAVDHRRQETSMETRDMNVKRLKAYLSKLILFPSKNSKRIAKKMGETKDVKARKLIVEEASADKLSSAAAKKQVTGKEVLPLQPQTIREKPQGITTEMKNEKVFTKLRIEKLKAKYDGVRRKRAEQARKEAEEKAAKGQ
eukprot:TRINITY_DN1232_c0_g1_i1.p1 TRINITY_DN1232_c0_g1~~TRINITY_DN1232_c0_g1_i1.p1  ORF type:complete len:233 (+),score=88.33 TRINITY_DN1232_c0_g1_i1:211-909(+)